MIRLQGESQGADAEVAFAREHSIPVYVVSCEPMLYVQSATMRVLEWWQPTDPTRRQIAEAFTGAAVLPAEAWPAP